ncbi:MAG TPA: response regulator transcription factor [Micromonosporaceae bacterium]|nr:response regulator transcription factor [Micromonosporaceae bacterium]
MSVRVLLADDQALVRSGFRVLLTQDPEIEVVGEVGDGAAAVEQAAALLPDVVLMDIRMPVLDGIEATRRICAAPATSACRVVVLTTYELDEYIFAALRAGASGFLLKDGEPADLRAAVHTVARGDALLAPRVTRRLVAEFARRTDASHSPAALDVLTARERDVLALVADGLSNAEIAAELVMSPATVKTHIGHLLTKLDARDRAQLVVVAYQTGFARGPR